MTGRKTSESYFAFSGLQSPVCGPRSPVSALCFLLGSQRLAQSVYTLPPIPYTLLSSWPPLRLRESHLLSDLPLFSELGPLCPMEYSHGRGVSVALVMLFHGASPVEYRLDQDRVVLPKRYSTGESDLFPIPYSQIQRKISNMLD